MRPTNRRSGLAALAISLFVLTFASAQKQPTPPESLMPPSELHRLMAESKRAALAQRWDRLPLAAGGRLDASQLSYDVQAYDIAIRIDDTTQTLYGAVTMTTRCVATQVASIHVDLAASLIVDSILSPTGRLAAFHDSDLVEAHLGRDHAEGEEFALTVYYHGHPNEGGFKGFAFDTHLDNQVISSLSEPYFARTWWPCKDRMDDKADSFSIAITVDTSFYVASNGTLDSVAEHGNNSHTFHYTERHPMATYLFSVAISDYEVWTDSWVYNDGLDTMPIVHAVYPDRLSYSRGKYDVTPHALTVLSELFGLYPFADEKYGHANFEWGGAMEHQTMSSMSGSDFGFSEQVVVHEMAHQWWGDMITCESWGHIWLNEGWASYAEALYYLEKDGWTTYHDYMRAMDYTGGGTIFVSDTTSLHAIFHPGLSYDKGAWVLHMLRGVLGDSLFFAGVRAYYDSQYQHGAITTEKFRDLFEQASGTELDWFFEEWIYGEHRPDYRLAWYQEPAPAGGVDFYLLVRQIQTTQPQVFDMPVDVFFDFAALPDDTLTFRIDKRRCVFKLNFPSLVDMVILDPAGWVMKYSNREVWELRIVTTDEELTKGVRKVAAYTDTVEAKGGSGDYEFSLISGGLAPGLQLSSDGVIFGTPTDTGRYDFQVRVEDNRRAYSDEADLMILIESPPAFAGDVNYDLDGPNLADVTYLTQYLYHSALPPPVMKAADLDSSCQVDLLDLLYFVDHLFRAGPAPRMGCAE